MENFTIQVPNGTTNHGNPNLICTPVSWSDKFIFFATNYFAHAFTVKQLPGEPLDMYVFAVVAALFYPYAGLPRGIESIFRAAIFFRKSELQTAARAGALCIVIRSKKWKPVAGQAAVENVHFERSKFTYDQPADGPRNASLKISFFNLTRRQIPTPSELLLNDKVHGLNKLPKDAGYELAVLPDNVVVDSNIHGIELKDFRITSSYNLAQAIVSLVQLISSTVTLFRARGDQIDHYGYAAFGLTVLPYITTSIVNSVGNLVTPNYEALYLVHSPELDEAKSHGCIFDGTVGTVALDDSKTLEGDGLNMSFYEDSENVTIDKLNDGKGEHFKLTKSSGDKIMVPACTPFQTSGNPSRHENWLLPLGFVFFVIPYAVIGGLTGFHKRQSTTAQRAWMMTWLVFDAFFGFIAGLPDWFDKKRSMGGYFLLAVLGTTPAIGGFVVVGQMLKYYGSCLDINSGIF